MRTIKDIEAELKMLKELKKEYAKTKKLRGQWKILKEKFGFKSNNSLSFNLKKAGVL